MMRKLPVFLLIILAVVSIACAEETIMADPDAGVWSYASDTFSVTINRVVDEEQTLIWYECDLFCSPESPLTAYSSNPKKPGSKIQPPEKIARDNKIVFAINDDYFGFRVFNEKRVGIILRHGALLYNKTYKSGSKNFPNLDTMALYPDGTFSVHDSKEYTGEEYLAMGATDVFAFGPWLIRGGEINPMLEKLAVNNEPRVSIGMVEPYHYKVLVVEGRHKESKGVPCSWMAEMLLQMGCTEAFNVDGGQTGVLMFMGEQLNHVGQYTSKGNYRNLSGVIGAGVSEQVPEYRD